VLPSTVERPEQRFVGGVTVGRRFNKFNKLPLAVSAAVTVAAAAWPGVFLSAFQSSSWSDAPAYSGRQSELRATLHQY